jgi:anti-anti-sigma factor
MRLTLLSNFDSVARLECEGEISQAQLSAGPGSIPDVLGPLTDPACVLLNLEKTNLIDSSGVSWLLTAHKQVHQSGGRLILHSAPPMVLQVLQLLRMTELLNVVPDEAAALRLARGEEVSLVQAHSPCGTSKRRSRW